MERCVLPVWVRIHAFISYLYLLRRLRSKDTLESTLQKPSAQVLVYKYHSPIKELGLFRGPEQRKYKMSLVHLVPENKGPENKDGLKKCWRQTQTDTGANLQ